ncbi:MAG: hypothetical protein Fues2KO_03920 [Fuerstiella sp.]
MTQRDLILTAFGLLVIGAGAIADNAMNGFGVEDEAALQDAVERLQQIPETVGQWDSNAGLLTEREQEAAGISGYVRRTYLNRRTGYTVEVTVLCGPSGPIAVHPPTACFEGIGYRSVAGPAVATFEARDTLPKIDLNRATFRQPDASVPEDVRVFWGWSTDGTWSAPENPRFAFRGHSYLYKLYITDRSLHEPDREARPQSEAFIREVLPQISAVLTGTSTGTSNTDSVANDSKTKPGPTMAEVAAVDQ